MMLFVSCGQCLVLEPPLIAENLFLRKQLGFYQEHQVKPRHMTDAARLSLVFWSRFCAWKSVLVVVKPATLIGWHRQAFRRFWRWKSRPGRHRAFSRIYASSSHNGSAPIRLGANSASPTS